MRTVLLDLDGCLVDSTEPIRRSLGEAFVALGLAPVEVAELGRIVGPPLAETVPALLRERGGEHLDARQVIAAYRARYRTSSLELAATYPGIDEALTALAAGARIGVVTSKPRVFAEPILAELDLLDRFELVEAPGPDERETKVVTLARALRRLGDPDPATVVMVGDRRHDIEAGRHHATATIGVTWGFGSREELVAAGADVVVDAPADLPAAASARWGP